MSYAAFYSNTPLYDTAEEAYAAIDASPYSIHYKVYEVTPAERPKPKDYMVVYEDTGELWSLSRFTRAEARAAALFATASCPLMVMRLVPDMEGENA